MAPKCAATCFGVYYWAVGLAAAVVALLGQNVEAQEVSCSMHANVTDSGSCMIYPIDGYCRNGYAGRSVWMANGTSFALYDALVRDSVDLLRKNSHQISPECLTVTETWVCSRFFPDCTSIDGFDIPKLLCKSECESYWTTCRQAFELYYIATVEIFKLMAVEEMNLQHCGAVGTFQAAPQPPDVFGEREIPLSPTWLEGYRGELRNPDGPGRFTLPNGTNVSIPCYTMTPLTQALDLEDIKCAYPLEPVVNGSQTICKIPCPFPLIPANDLRSIGWAFVIPGIIGLAFSVFVCLDTLWVIFDTNGGGQCYKATCKLWVKKSTNSRVESATDSPTTAHESSADDSPTRQRGKFRSSQAYALLGSLLGVTYFVIGPLMTLLRAEKISCGEDEHFDIANLREETQDVGDSMCKAQRIAPFVLQATFNLMLYALVRVLLMVDQRFRKWEQRKLSIIRYSILAYCLFGPIVCMAIALALDKTTKDVILLFGELARQTAICTMRISRAQEIVLVFIPFIVTGMLISALSLYIFTRLSSIQAGVKDFTSGNRKSDVALRQLMLRLSVLGVATFVVIIVLLSTTGYVINAMEIYSPRFNAWFACETTKSLCTLGQEQHCPTLNEEANAARPSYAAFAVQIAAMSCISMLLSGFFAAQSAPRLYHEIKSGALGQKLDNILEGRPLHYNVGKSGSVEPASPVSSPLSAAGKLPTMPVSKATSNGTLSVSDTALGVPAAYMVGQDDRTSSVQPATGEDAK